MKQRNDLTFYDRVAAEWWQPDSQVYALHHLNPLRFAYFDRYIANWQGLRVLDVGCGGGYTCEFLASRGSIVSGVDPASQCIHAAQEHARSVGQSICYQLGAAEALPFQSGEFDVVVCVDVLEHVADLPQTIQEIQRVLKPQGWFCFDTINRTFWSKLIMIWLLEDWLRLIPAGIHDWQQFITPPELTHLLIQAGFQPIDLQGFNLFGTTLWDYWIAYRYYRQTGGLQAQISNDCSVMYIGVAQNQV
ncbi:MAG: bifunctional 2-polyprenyl-6-hydroxyphenol methylase/3-demethylubiquinol 3-O-methyltransferase UbiG [Elainella sp. Prado103]|jgi:2-polyprenyl-6-hydroxyphenyl methylase/3-demethylubiquinone-9 3-methyltransferase|nr:bifunctional 2-polyprenyl-6-hydroxyphenol methylase/3-demethylubiquinol 3-O-methyltransferase UbiG [Elainella sp. Prado103]